MSTSLHYKANLRDIYFNLFEDLRIQDTTLGKGEFADMDEQTAREALAALEKLCTEEMCKSFVDSDRIPLTLDGDGNVTLPPSLSAAMRTFYEQGWHLFELPTRLGGYGAPPSVIWAGFELQVGANPAMAFYLFGGYIARTIDRLGTERQKARYVQNMVDGGWGGCMVLTEPDAGSDVGAGRSKAKHIEGDVWELEGVKRFITNGDYDGPDNIVHLVLARPEGAGPGTRGLSMFIVPKYWVNEDGSLGERNGAYVTNIEKKMGLKGSATCELTMGDRGPCRGLLVGDEHAGIRQMFTVIEHARMAVGTKSMATLSTAYLNALEYAKERVQGADLKQAADKSAPRVRIIEHPDVRRMLMLQKSHAEGLRALIAYTASLSNERALATHGTPEAVLIDRVQDLLLPLVKGYSSERVYELLAVSLQTFGGSGYCQDYPIEQYCRDQKIDSLYEGTTHIQALDLFFRKVARDGGETLKWLMAQIQTTTEGLPESMAAEQRAMARALNDCGAIFPGMMGKIRESVYHVGLHGNRILMSLAELVIGWRLVRHAKLAHEALPNATGRDRDFYTGKIASATFFCAEALPNITLHKKVIENGTLDLMDLDEASF